MAGEITRFNDSLNELIQVASLSLDEFERKLIQTMALMKKGEVESAKKELLKGDWIYAGGNSAYLWSNYEEVINLALDTHHLFDFNKIPRLMPDEELERRISDIEKTLDKFENVRAERYTVVAKNLFARYMKNEISRDALNEELDRLEEKFPLKPIITEKFKAEVKKIFKGYFWGREEISWNIADKYQEYIRCCYLTFSLEQYLKSAEENELEVVTRDMPRVESYSIGVGEIFVDPTIPGIEKVLDSGLTDEEKKLVIFKALFYKCITRYFSVDDDESGVEVNSVKWNNLKEKFPQSAEEFVRRGIEYHQKIEDEKNEKINAIREKYIQKRADLSSEEFESIAQIFVGTADTNMIYVVE